MQPERHEMAVAMEVSQLMKEQSEDSETQEDDSELLNAAHLIDVRHQQSTSGATFCELVPDKSDNRKLTHYLIP